MLNGMIYSIVRFGSQISFHHYPHLSLFLSLSLFLCPLPRNYAVGHSFTTYVYPLDMKRDYFRTLISVHSTVSMKFSFSAALSFVCCCLSPNVLRT